MKSAHIFLTHRYHTPHPGCIQFIDKRKKQSVGNHWIDTFEWILNGKQWAPVIQTFRLEFVLFNDLAQMKIKQLVSIGNFTSAICLHFKINYIFIICLNNWNYFCIPLLRYKFSVLALTYVAYTCYHLTRKPISVVKAVLHRNCSAIEIPKQIKLVTDASNESTWCDYAPFGM